MPLPKIAALALTVSDPEGLVAFYCDILGMRCMEDTSALAVGYGGENARLEFAASTDSAPYRTDRNDRYWKIAITLPDLDCAYRQLRARGIEVTAPNQFRDIAYMSHLADPQGNTIELIQHTFGGNPLTRKGDEAQPLGGGTRLGLITLRTDDLDAEFRTCRDELGMRYLSRQDVPDFDFCLYFFAFADEATPVPDVNAVENREWLWQRPYTVLEFQHRKAGRIARRSSGQTGAAAVLIENPGAHRTVLR
ncbi:VOC family protein [Roseibium sp.]|uniref:VOC family protein n=1 Tax=Roseibium sp. TaxID=1936156 RepID=UPI003B513222